jgi:hypothetical protein
MIKNYSNQDKKIAIKLKKILKNNFRPDEVVDDTNLTSNQTDSQADFLALRIIDNLIRFNQSFRLSQVAIKANMGKYNKKGSGVKFVGGVFTHEHIAENFKTIKGAPFPVKDEPAKGYREYNGKYYTTTHYNFIKLSEKMRQEKKADIIKYAILTTAAKNKVKKLRDEKATKELEELNNKKLEELLNQFDGDSKFPSSFEALLNAYSLLQNIDRNYRDLRPIFNNISVPVFNDLNDILDETNELIINSVKSFNLGNSYWMKKSISHNIDDYKDKFSKIVSIFNNIYNDFQQRKQTFNTNMKTGSGFGYLSKIRNI